MRLSESSSLDASPEELGASIRLGFQQDLGGWYDLEVF